MSKSYSDLLRDPRWQRKRLEVMERDGFSCRECAAKDRTLNVHHTYYAKGRKPWEYEDDSLVTLCEECHKDVSGKLAELSRIAGSLRSGMLDELLGFARYYALTDTTDDQPIVVSTYEQALGVCAAAGVTDMSLISAVLRMSFKNGGCISSHWFQDKAYSFHAGELVG